MSVLDVLTGLIHPTEEKVSSSSDSINSINPFLHSARCDSIVNPAPLEPTPKEKMAKVAKFIRKHQDIVNRVRQEISDDGLSIDSIWEEDGL